jgi:hypothetical protein
MRCMLRGSIVNIDFFIFCFDFLFFPFSESSHSDRRQGLPMLRDGDRRHCRHCRPQDLARRRSTHDEPPGGRAGRQRPAEGWENRHCRGKSRGVRQHRDDGHRVRPGTIVDDGWDPPQARELHTNRRGHQSGKFW